MPSLIRVQHVYNHKSGLAKDAVVNTFHFSAPVDDATLNTGLLDDVIDAVLDFYDAAATGAPLTIAQLIAETSLAPSRHTVKIYDMEDDKPRQPIRTRTTANGRVNNANPGGPAEVALCLSYRGELVSGLKPARRRGRIYIGPLKEGNGTTDISGHYRPSAEVMATLIAAGVGLANRSDIGGWNWCVYSQGLNTGEFGGGDFEPSNTPITHLWCDNAWDTQRRRGPAPNTRAAVDA